MSSTQISRDTIVSVLIAQAAVLFVHTTRLPYWILVVCILAAVWRLALYTGRGRFPPAWVRASLVIGGVVCMWLTTPTFYSLEPLVTLLVFAFALKLIEMRTHRDVLVIIFIAYAVAGSHFLFHQTPLGGVYMVIAITCVTGALVTLHQSDSQCSIKDAYVSAGKLLAQAAPLMLILFLTFPRLAPLWGVPQMGSQAKTGPSDSMSPGDIAELTGSSAVAFRVTFTGQTPAPDLLYFRGLVFSDFDGRTWAVNREHQPSNRQKNSTPSNQLSSLQKAHYRYSVLLEPSRQPYLYALAGSRSTTAGVNHQPQSLLSVAKPLTKRFTYQVASNPDMTRDATLTVAQRARALKLPAQGNTQTLALARRLRNRHTDNQDLIQAVLSMFRQQQFVYTLKPGILGSDSVDEFLFESKRGFCEHYASSFTFLMRAAGVPARIVVGYQGGEVNPYENYLLVHQYDAHAWAEVWLAGVGWTRVDPTAAVAPDRIEQGMQQLWEQQQTQTQTLISPMRWRHIEGLKWLRLRWDAINYAWSKWVVNYDTKRQYSVLKRWLGEINFVNMLAFVVGGGSAIFALIALTGFVRRRVGLKRDTLDRLYLRHALAAKRAGLERDQAEGVRDFAERIASEQPGLAAEAWMVADTYMQGRYNTRGAVSGQSTCDPELLKTMKHAVSKFERRVTGNQRSDVCKFPGPLATAKR